MFDWTRRVPRTVLCALVFLGLVMPPAMSQQRTPTVVAVSVTGNAHVPTDRILAVVKTKAGDPFNPAVVQEDLRAINDLGFFGRGTAGYQTAPRRGRGHVSRHRASGRDAH